MDGGATSLLKWSKKVTPSLVERLIRSEKELERAILIFDSATADYTNGFRHDHTTFALMLSRLVSANQFGPAEALLGRMKEEKCEIKEDALLCLCRGYGRIHRPSEALRVFHKMEEVFHCPPTSKSYVTLLSILVQENQLKAAFRFYKYMKHRGVPPLLASLNILLKALCKNTHTLDAALHMFREMPSRGFPPDSYTYGTLINGFCRFGKLTDAKKLFEEMEGKGCLPSVVTYTNLIHGLCHHGSLDEAVRLFKEMGSKGVSANVFTYTSLINGFCRAGKSSEAMELFNQMITRRHSPNTFTYTTLISGLCKDRKVEEAVEMLDRMKLQGLKADAGLYAKIIIGLCDICRFREAAGFIDEMVLEGVSPNRLTWSLHVRVHNTVVQGLCAVSASRAYQVYLSSRSRGITVDEATFEGLVKCLCEKGEMHKAGRVVEEMAVDGCVPSEQMWKSLVETFWDRRPIMVAGWMD